MQILGIDIGGTGIKGAPVDLEVGKLVGERYRIETPNPGTADAVIDAISQIVTHFGYKGPFGCTFPGVVRGGKIETAAHLDSGWVGIAAEEVLVSRLGQPSTVLNDADAAALAEARYGAGKGVDGLVALVTLGTGIGTGLIYRGTLIPNSELGHLEVHGKDAEKRASNTAREERDMSWKKWAKRVSDYLQKLEALVNPDLIVVGGGVVKDADKFLPRLETHTPIKIAELGNLAGIVGAALACSVAQPAAAGRKPGRR